ncbi:MAG: glycoside hydrolase family 75 protein [Candidatus Melainabacteria bacterium]|nr:glycoside hydrolase family 75 protein [Candidatus Melainabacteria bacterium]
MKLQINRMSVLFSLFFVGVPSTAYLLLLQRSHGLDDDFLPEGGLELSLPAGQAYYGVEKSFGIVTLGGGASSGSTVAAVAPTPLALFRLVAGAGGGVTGQFVKIADGLVYLKGGMAIDADGSPRATAIDPYGQLETSLTYPDGKFVNSEVVNYIALPMGIYSRYGISPGDFAVVKYGNRYAYAIFADVAPPQVRGEGSMALAAALGINNSPTGGGVSQGVEYLIFAGSGTGKAVSPAEINSRGDALFRQFLHRFKK